MGQVFKDSSLDWKKCKQKVSIFLTVPELNFTDGLLFMFSLVREEIYSYDLGFLNSCISLSSLINMFIDLLLAPSNSMPLKIISKTGHMKGLSSPDDHFHFNVRILSQDNECFVQEGKQVAIRIRLSRSISLDNLFHCSRIVMSFSPVRAISLPFFLTL